MKRSTLVICWLLISLFTSAQAIITGTFPSDYKLPHLTYSRQQEYELRAPFDTLLLQDGRFYLRLNAEGTQRFSIP